MLRTASILEAVRTMRRALPRWTRPALGAAALVALGGALLAVAPAFTRRAQELVASAQIAPPSAAWADTLLSCGAALGGGAALIFVLTQLSREVEKRPYACFAPVLAAFAACVAIAIQPSLPLPGVGAESIAVMVMSATCVGGGLLMASRLSAQLIGLALTLFPAFSLLLVVWAATGRSDPGVALWSLGARTLAYLGLLLLTAFAIAVIATLGREAEYAAKVASMATPIPAEPTPTERMSLNSGERFVESLRTRGFRAFRPRLPGWQSAFLVSIGLLLGCGLLKVMLTAQAMPAVSVPPLPTAPAVSMHAALLPVQEPSAAPVVTPLGASPPPVAPVLGATMPASAPRIEKTEHAKRIEGRRPRRHLVRAKKAPAQRSGSKAMPAWEAATKPEDRGAKPATRRAEKPAHDKQRAKVAAPPATSKKAGRGTEEESLDALMRKAMGK